MEMENKLPIHTCPISLKTFLQLSVPSYIADPDLSQDPVYPAAVNLSK